MSHQLVFSWLPKPTAEKGFLLCRLPSPWYPRQVWPHSSSPPPIIRLKYMPGPSVLSDPHNPWRTAVLQMRAAEVQEEFFLLTKEHGISFCILRWQLWVWVSFTVARSRVVIPAQWCSDKRHGPFLAWHTIRNLFVLMLIALPLKVRNPDFDSHDWFIYYSIWIWTMLWIFNYILIIILVINFISTFLPSSPPFNLSFASSLNCLNNTSYFLKSIYFYSLFFFWPPKRTNSGSITQENFGRRTTAVCL